MSDEFKGFDKSRIGITDEVVSPSQRAMVWVTRNATPLTYLGGTLLFILLLILGFALVQGNRVTSANMALVDAVNLYQPLAQRSDAATGDTASPERLREAMAAFREVAANYPSMPQGKAASLYTANILFVLGSYNEAAATVEELARLDGPFVSRFGGTYLLAKSYEGAKDYSKALVALSQVRDHAQGDFRGQVLLDMARCAQLSGDPARAEELYQKVKADFPADNPITQRAEKMLVLLEASAAPAK